MSDKPIPNGYSDFLTKAQTFTSYIVRDPQRFGVSQEDSDALACAVKTFGDAYQKAWSPTNQTDEALRHKKRTRRDAETIWRRLRNTIRASNQVDATSKELLGLAPAKRSTKVLMCPQEPPDMRFVRALHEGASATPMHELRFTAMDYRKAKPPGAVKLELFIDLIGLDEEVPTHPAENYGGRPWYVGSYPRSPIILAPPMPRVPMVMLYWARWAGNGPCDVGPFCATVVAPMVGGMKRFLGVKWERDMPMPMMEDKSERRDVTIRVAVMEVQRAMMLPNAGVVETKRLEGPEQDEMNEAA